MGMWKRERRVKEDGGLTFRVDGTGRLRILLNECLNLLCGATC